MGYRDQNSEFNARFWLYFLIIVHYAQSDRSSEQPEVILWR